jgi:hypothetical protein
LIMINEFYLDLAWIASLALAMTESSEKNPIRHCERKRSNPPRNKLLTTKLNHKDPSNQD